MHDPEDALKELEALEALDEDHDDLEPLPFRVLYDGFSGECVLAPVEPQPPAASLLYLQRVAGTTTPFGLPLLDPLTELKDQFLKPTDILDEAIDGLSGPRVWNRDLYTISLDSMVLSTARTTLIRSEQDQGVKEVPVEVEEGPRQEAEARVGMPAVRTKVVGGLGKLKDYSKRNKEVPNPYAPNEGLGIAATAVGTGEIERSLKVFDLGDEMDPYVLEAQLLRTPPHVIFEKGLGADDVIREMGGQEAVQAVRPENVKVDTYEDELDYAGLDEQPPLPSKAGSTTINFKELYYDDDDQDLYDDEEEEQEEVKAGETGEEEGEAEEKGGVKDEKEDRRAKAVEEGLKALTSGDQDQAEEDDDEEIDIETVIEGGASSTGSRRAAKYQRSVQGADLNMHSWAVLDRLDVSDFKALVPRMAMHYPFELDDFQKQAVARLERGEYVFVAAHTSAGKTVVAEYAIALAIQHMTRAVYTSPIKALSNQKYRDFRDRFGVENVGLITGDVSVNPEGSCLVMTTEILRSMLYRGADLIRDIEWVIFDEVHYVNDIDRGVVWEEVIIMLPDHVSMIFLSATTPNTKEFSDWIGRTRKKPVHVVTTDYRPVPLSHFMYAGGELFKVLEGKSNFSSAAYNKAVEAFTGKKDDKSRGGRGGGGGGGAPRYGSGPDAGARSQWQHLVNKLKKDSLLPAVVFSFSKKRCEECADYLTGDDLNDKREKSQVHLITTAAIKRLQPKDQSLPQVERTLELCRRGVGVHHGGMLPILKEIVEILFSKGLVKVLFATETFAMGVNMPARTVVFNGTRKHDGRDFRDLLPGEYTQMAGRAGRRGLDTVGTVIITCWREPMPMVILQKMLTGSATRLSSQFRLTYNMILNLLRTEDMSVEDMIKRSFSEFSTQRALGARDLPSALERLDRLIKKQEAKGLQPCLKGEPDIENYYAYTRNVASLTSELVANASSVAKANAQGLLGTGRVIKVTNGRLVNAIAMVIRPPVEPLGPAKQLVGVVLCPEGFIPPDAATLARKKGQQDSGGAPPLDGRSNSFGQTSMGTGAKQDKDSQAKWPDVYGSTAGRVYGVVGLRLDSIVLISNKRMKGVAVDGVLGGADKRSSALMTVVEYLMGSEKEALEAVNIAKELKTSDLDYVQENKRLGPLQKQQLDCKCHDCPLLPGQYAHMDKLRRLQAKQAQLRHILSNESLTLFPDFQQRLCGGHVIMTCFSDGIDGPTAVLKYLGYVTPENVVQVKGRVACEVNTCEELLLTEIVFENVLEKLTPHEIAGLLSSLICQEKNQEEQSVSSTPALKEACDKVIQLAKDLGHVQRRHALTTDPETYAKQSVNLCLVDVVYDWARGIAFSDICVLTPVPEGSIVRTITRLDELCREVRNAARIIGDPTLYRKMEEASESIKRDIVFAGSLYLT